MVAELLVQVGQVAVARVVPALVDLAQQVPITWAAVAAGRAHQVQELAQAAKAETALSACAISERQLVRSLRARTASTPRHRPADTRSIVSSNLETW